MTFEHHDWIGSAFVANRAAGTTTGKGYFHVLVIAQLKDNDSFVLILAALPAALALSGDKHPSLASRSRSSLVRENPAKRPASHGADILRYMKTLGLGFGQCLAYSACCFQV
jgi:hypothetical protein